jgi:hypothetical protein
MTGAWDHLPRLAEHFGINPVELRDLLSGYCAELLVRGMPHQSDLLSLVLEKGLGR